MQLEVRQTSLAAYAENSQILGAALKMGVPAALTYSFAMDWAEVPTANL